MQLSSGMAESNNFAAAAVLVSSVVAAALLESWLSAPTRRRKRSPCAKAESVTAVPVAALESFSPRKSRRLSSDEAENNNFTAAVAPASSVAAAALSESLLPPLPTLPFWQSFAEWRRCRSASVAVAGDAAVAKEAAVAEEPQRCGRRRKKTKSSSSSDSVRTGAVPGWKNSRSASVAVAGDAAVAKAAAVAEEPQRCGRRQKKTTSSSSSDSVRTEAVPGRKELSGGSELSSSSSEVSFGDLLRRFVQDSLAVRVL